MPAVLYQWLRVPRGRHPPAQRRTNWLYKNRPETVARLIAIV